jgi:GrpB-like predicted nucleotidyltransferase (UPF0157 family)
MSEIEDFAAVLGLEPWAVRLCDHSPLWKQAYEIEAGRIRSVLGDRLVDIQHFGSTSIPGIKAKPIVDMLIGIRRFDCAPSCVPLMESIGYDYAPEAGIPGDFTFGKPKRRTHLAHVVEFGSSNWTDNLRFRDALRNSRDLALEYEQLKIKLSRELHDRASYTAGKSEFIARVIAQHG